MTEHLIEDFVSSPSRAVGAEVRVELARRGQSQRWLARQLFVNQTWVSRRISPTSEVEMTLEEIVQMAEALGVSAQRLISTAFTSIGRGDSLPRLDSNQQPSGYLSALVRRVRRWRERRAVGPLAIVLDLEQARIERAA